MENFIDYLMGLHWQTVIAMYLIGWYYSRDIKEELKLFRGELKQQGARTDKLYEMFIDLIKEKRGEK